VTRHGIPNGTSPAGLNNDVHAYAIFPRYCYFIRDPLHEDDTVLDHYTLSSESGKAYLTGPQQVAAMAAIEKQKIIERIETNLSSLQLHFPQVKTQTSGSLCNETAYSKFSLVILQGFFRIDESK